MINRLSYRSPFGLPGCLSVSTALLMGSVTLNAQDNQDEEEIKELERYIVTGSLIPITEVAVEARPIPVEIFDRHQIDRTGFVKTEEILANLSVNNGGSVPISNNAVGFTPGATSVSLRGLGPEATLVLVNGRRVAPFPTGTGGTTAFVDLNTIPSSAIERIEILKDGASATYGADAVAGVVNIITRSDYEGGELNVRYGNETNGNDSSESMANIVYGVTNDRGGITAGANYYKRNAIFNRDREFSTTPPFLSSNASPLNAWISGEAAREALGLAADAPLPCPACGEDFNPAQDDTFWATSGPETGLGEKLPGNQDANNQGAVPASDYSYGVNHFGAHSRFNFNLTSGTYPETERFGGFVTWHRKLLGTDNVETYGDLNFQQITSQVELAPSATGNFFNPSGVSLVIPARTPNPIISPDCAGNEARCPGGRLPEVAEGAFNPHNPFNQDLEGRTRIRLFDFGNRVQQTNTDNLMATVGIRGARIRDKWNFDAGLRLSRVEELEVLRRVSTTLFNRLVNGNDPWFDPSSTSFLGTTSPFNPFGYFENPLANNVAIVQNGVVELHDFHESELLTAWGQISTNDLIQVPGGGVGLAVGFDWREEEIFQSPDVAKATGDVIGSSTSAITRARRRIRSYFYELAIPVISPEMDSKVHALDVNIAGRFEDFITSQRNAFVPKFSVRLAPREAMAFRASWGQGFREPSLYELFASSTFALAPISNPKTGTSDPEVDISIRGNTALGAEETESWNVGWVWTPQKLSNFTVNLDFWNITRDGTVTTNPQDTVDRFFSGAALLPGESVETIPSGEITLINTVFQNQGRTDVKGLDINLSYVHDTDKWGTFNVVFSATKLLKYLHADTKGGIPFHRVGFGTETEFAVKTEPVGNDFVFGPFDSTGDLMITTIGDNEDAILEWKFNVGFTWKVRNFSTTLNGYYTDGFFDIDENFEGRMVDDHMIWDLHVNYSLFPKSTKWLSATTVTLGVDNVFSSDPPRTFADFNNSTGYPGFLYDATGQFIWVGIKKKL